MDFPIARSKTSNIEHRTLNIECGTAREARQPFGVRCSMFDVRCSPMPVHCATLLAILALCLSHHSLHAAAAKIPPIISLSTNGHLIYEFDAQSNRVPDFSWCGYANGNEPIPDVPVRIVVAPMPGDSTARIQRALDYVAGLAPDANGLRGAVLLLKGRHEISGDLRLDASGVVLRGQGMGTDGTVLVATGEDRRTLLRMVGK